MKRKNNTLLSLVLPAVLCTALWGSAAPCVKKGYKLFEIAAGDSFSQLVFAGWRFTLAGVLVLLVAACMGHRIRPKRGEYRAIFMISLFQSMLQYVCYYIGLAGTTGTKASVLSGTQTFFALLLAHRVPRFLHGVHPERYLQALAALGQLQILLCLFALPLQRAHALLQLAQDIPQAHQIFLGGGQAALGLIFAVAVFGDAGRFLKNFPALV